MYLLRAAIRIQMKPLSREALSLMEEAFLAMWTEYREMGLVHCTGCSKEQRGVVLGPTRETSNSKHRRNRTYYME